jgi:sigma-B regulation protein RsbU (phosphoserine phosphatase)
MVKGSLFRFQSITHRLIFGCVTAAIAIYGASYFQVRYLVREIVGGWTLDLARSQIYIVVDEIERQLEQIEQSIWLSLDTLPTSLTELDGDRQDKFRNLVAKQSKIIAVAAIDEGNKITEIYGKAHLQYTDFQAKDPCGRDSLHCCQAARLQANNYPFWTQAYYINKPSTFWAITYCFPVSRFSGIKTKQNLGTKYWLAVVVSLDWLSLSIDRHSINSQAASYRQLGDPFVVSPSNRQWLVSPKNPQLSSSEYLAKIVSPNSLAEDSHSLIKAQVSSTSLLVGLIFAPGKLEEFQQNYLSMAIASMIKDMALMCLVIAYISKLTTRPLRALNDSTREMAKGNLETNLPPVNSDDEVGRLTESFQIMRDSLQLHIRNLEETTAAKQKLESELSIAAQIQRTMIPRINLENKPNPLYQISALLQPARIVGGDFYDFFLLDRDRLCLIIGDVAGKGFPAALHMARTITLIRTLSKPLSTPAEILSVVNEELCADNEECLFVTLFCGVIDLTNGNFVYASSGHDSPLLIRDSLHCCSSDRQVSLLDLETGPPLGLYKELQFPENHCLLRSNDLIIFYTDGITEAMNAEDEIFSQERLIKIISCYPPIEPVRGIRTIQHFHQQFVGHAPQSDDLTLLILQYLPSSPFSQIIKSMKWNLTIDSELIQLEEVKEKLNKIFQANNLSIETNEDAQLIVEEVLVNIIQHGYEPPAKGNIDLEIEIFDEELKITFQDNGKPFNPISEIVAVDLSMDEEQRALGGFGFFLVKELAKRLDYQYVKNRNILTIWQKITKNV